MEEILKTVVFDFGKSTYRIELVKSNNNKTFVAIEQIVYSSFSPKKTNINIRHSALDIFIRSLSEMLEVIPAEPSTRKSSIKPAYEAEMIRRYLNTGLEIETLAVQFDCTVDDIKHFFRHAGIEVTSNKLSQSKPAKRFWRKGKKRGDK